MINSVDKLNEKITACTKCLDDKIAGADGKRHIVLCGGTGCLSNNSAEIRERFVKVLEEKGASDKAASTAGIGPNAVRCCTMIGGTLTGFTLQDGNVNVNVGNPSVVNAENYDVGGGIYGRSNPYVYDCEINAAFFYSLNLFIHYPRAVKTVINSFISVRYYKVYGVFRCSVMTFISAYFISSECYRFTV